MARTKRAVTLPIPVHPIPVRPIPEVTPEQQQAARDRMRADAARARRDGVYDRMKSWRGRITWTESLDELGKDDRDCV